MLAPGAVEAQHRGSPWKGYEAKSIMLSIRVRRARANVQGATLKACADDSLRLSSRRTAPGKESEHVYRHQTQP
jgi:hypothetical protein